MLKPPPPPQNDGAEGPEQFPRGVVSLSPSHELQLVTSHVPIMVTVPETTTNTVSAEVFGENLVPGHPYILAPQSCLSITTFTGCQLELIGNPAYATMTRSNEDFYMQLLNLSTVLNKARLGVLEQLRSRPRLGMSKGGPRVLIWGPGRRCGKSAAAQILLNYSLRTGWKPTLVALDPGGRSSDIQRAYQGGGILAAYQQDYCASPEGIVAFLEEYWKSDKRVDVLRAWGRRLQNSDEERESVNMGGKRGGNMRHLSDPKAQAIATISSLAKREAANHTDGKIVAEPWGVADDDVFDGIMSPSNMRDTIAAANTPNIVASLSSWERLISPTHYALTPPEYIDAPDIVATCCGTTDLKKSHACEPNFVHAAATLAAAAENRWHRDMNSDSGELELFPALTFASGMIIDTASDVSFTALQRLVDTYKVDKLIFLSLLDSIPPELAKFCMTRSVEILPSHGFSLDLPPEVVQQVQHLEEHKDLISSSAAVQYPAFSPLNPLAFFSGLPSSW
eukprot:Blabericola_migrator_1__1054@NODE_1269_length_4935_cov_145_462818_g856_i0_p1_GENE_NODE_1269_length_4935_cov_145_462818_g856_i0NODE_1269_length_4935_cov_145_462818_g856_i0_p1_ORF_typecomplete_len508_score59_27CLP1_N/PF16573_5/2_4e10CLP1_P/PF16575_5/1_6e05CLP1_P/PF16575_5/1_1TetR_C_35/PF18556_1/0_071_NODE_1269_length_4935_cov_145_462818_g856_i030004523